MPFKFFCAPKNDQTGEKKHPRHIYPNPFEPVICPLLVLSIYLCYFSHILTGDGCLFPGNDQYCRFSRLLARVIETHRDEVIRMGHDPAFIGVHSIRKGAATYASSGSTCCPSGAAVNLRVGWTLGNVQDKYIWYEAAGDQFCGRVLSGLPVNSFKFASVGPRFIFNKDTVDSIDLQNQINACVQLCFMSSPRNFDAILTHGLASLICHQNFLQQLLPANHRFLSSAFF